MVIALNHFAITATVTQFPLEWGPTLTSFFNAMRFMSGSALADGAFSLECVSTAAWFDSAVCMALLPLVIVASVY